MNESTSSPPVPTAEKPLQIVEIAQRLRNKLTELREQQEQIKLEELELFQFQQV